MVTDGCITRLWEVSGFSVCVCVPSKAWCPGNRHFPQAPFPMRRKATLKWVNKNHANSLWTTTLPEILRWVYVASLQDRTMLLCCVKPGSVAHSLVNQRSTNEASTPFPSNDVTKGHGSSNHPSCYDA